MDAYMARSTRCECDPYDHAHCDQYAERVNRDWAQFDGRDEDVREHEGQSQQSVMD
jgi:hypothetical protein